jgi:hypothetical protein
MSLPNSDEIDTACKVLVEHGQTATADWLLGFKEPESVAATDVLPDGLNTRFRDALVLLLVDRAIKGPDAMFPIKYAEGAPYLAVSPKIIDDVGGWALIVGTGGLPENQPELLFKVEKPNG